MSQESEDPRHPVDVAVGLAIRSRRNALGLSQEALAAAVALTFQQIQKYERGHNRVSASKLYDLAAALDCAPGDFFPKAEAHSVAIIDHNRRLNDLAPGLAAKLARLPRNALAAIERTADIILSLVYFQTDEEIDAAIHERSANPLNREAA